MATILIVDDNKMNLQVLGNILSEEGHKVAMSTNGMSVPKLIQKASPDLIILDIMMPGMDGFEVCTNLKADGSTRDIPVIFLTAKTDLDSIIEGFRLGGVDYVTKPFRKEELLARVGTHLELIRSRKLIEQQANELQSLNQLKDKIFTVVSNDIQGAIFNFSYVYNMMHDHQIDLDKDDLKGFFFDLKQKSDSTSVLLENLLWWSKSQQKLVSPRFEEIVLSDLAGSLLPNFQAKLDNKNLVVNIQDESKIKAVADKEQLLMVLKNVIDNAIKFSKPGGEILIECSEEDGSPTVKISDSGIGMNEETLKRVLDKYDFFFEYGTVNEKGTGIGLLLSRELLELNNGKLEMMSVKDSGTTVKVTLSADIII